MSTSREKPAARVPQRERGKRRVSALLEAAVALFAEKGYDAVTMTEVAARAGAPIGSLYQFFPGKESLADAVLDRIGEHLRDALDAIEARAATLGTAGLADALLGLLAGLRQERAAASALIEARQGASDRAAALKLAQRRQVARILRAGLPGLPEERARLMALAMIPLMKAAARADTEDAAVRADTLGELRSLARLYLDANRAGAEAARDPSGKAPARSTPARKAAAGARKKVSGRSKSRPFAGEP